MRNSAGILLSLALCAGADEGHHHPGKLGTVRFPVSCGEKVQPEFNRGMAMLHSFWYDEAEKTFTKIAEADPVCGMAHWGVAMSNYHPIWAPPTADELKRGAAAAEKAAAVGARTEREKDYIAAIGAFYRDSEKLDHRTRALVYEKAMEQLYQRHAKDDEAAIFYALALLSTAPPTDKTYTNQKKAAGILNSVLPRHKDHPGVAHYIIHSFDYPNLAPLALGAARAYAKIAPDSPHALHMPSHIFTRLGLWEDSIQSNIASASAARRHVARVKPGAGSFDQLHAMDYLAYGYLQRAQDRKAKQTLDEMLAISTLDAENFAAAYAFAAIPARYVVERQQWSEAAGITLHPSGFPWKNFPYAAAMVHFARGVGLARSGNVEGARKEVEKLAEIQRALAAVKAGYDWASQVEVQRRAVSGWLAQADGRSEEAVRTLRSAADLEDSTDKHPVTPGAVLPAREMLGELLLEQRRPAEALAEFEAALQEAPGRFRGLAGAGRAARLAGQRDKARTHYEKLVKLCAKADSERPELAEARGFLAQRKE